MISAAQINANNMEIPQPIVPSGSAHELSVIQAGPGTPTIDPERFVSLVLARDGVPEALVLVMPVRDASRPNGAAPSVLQRGADDADLPPSLSSRSPGAIDPIDDPARENTSGDLLISEIVDRLSAERPTVVANKRLRPRAESGCGDITDEISEAEARVLRYLPTNLTASEIAATLFVSVNTVKTHMRHIYAKLDAHRRREAVDRARTLGLLTSSSWARANGIQRQVSSCDRPW
jgi:LuxR family maltose regulon positive regulatory protein